MAAVPRWAVEGRSLGWSLPCGDAARCFARVVRGSAALLAALALAALLGFVLRFHQWYYLLFVFGFRPPLWREKWVAVRELVQGRPASWRVHRWTRRACEAAIDCRLIHANPATNWLRVSPRNLLPHREDQVRAQLHRETVRRCRFDDFANQLRLSLHPQASALPATEPDEQDWMGVAEMERLGLMEAAR